MKYTLKRIGQWSTNIEEVEGPISIYENDGTASGEFAGACEEYGLDFRIEGLTHVIVSASGIRAVYDNLSAFVCDTNGNTIHAIKRM